ncbi:MAG: hypothetical protein QOD93_4844 [Acetobacteraceae bacterium]|nr:hypothetical protein [Acetobacteraceae bacterium]
MVETKPSIRVAIDVATLAVMIVLAACGGPSPQTRTITTEQTTASTPRPAISTTTTTTEQTRQP